MLSCGDSVCLSCLERSVKNHCNVNNDGLACEICRQKSNIGNYRFPSCAINVDLLRFVRKQRENKGKQLDHTTDPEEEMKQLREKSVVMEAILKQQHDDAMKMGAEMKQLREKSVKMEAALQGKIDDVAKMTVEIMQLRENNAKLEIAVKQRGDASTIVEVETQQQPEKLKLAMQQREEIIRMDVETKILRANIVSMEKLIDQQRDKISQQREDAVKTEIVMARQRDDAIKMETDVKQQREVAALMVENASKMEVSRKDVCILFVFFLRLSFVMKCISLKICISKCICFLMICLVI